MHCSQINCPFMGVKECEIDGPKCEYFTPHLKKVSVISPEGITQIGYMDSNNNIYGLTIPFEMLAHERCQVIELT